MSVQRKIKNAGACSAPEVVETFRNPGWELAGMRQDRPSCFNDCVRVRRYRITVEQIDEPVSILAERLQLLWDHSTNHHDTNPLRNAAKELGYELRGDRGQKAKRTK